MFDRLSEGKRGTLGAGVGGSWKITKLNPGPRRLLSLGCHPSRRGDFQDRIDLGLLQHRLVGIINSLIRDSVPVHDIDSGRASLAGARRIEKGQGTLSQRIHEPGVNAAHAFYLALGGKTLVKTVSSKLLGQIRPGANQVSEGA